MSTWYIILGAVVFIGLLVIPLGSRWYVGLGFASLGAVVAGGIAVSIGWLYVTQIRQPLPPNIDIDVGAATALVFIPAVSALVGFVLGLVTAYARVKSRAHRRSMNPDALESGSSKI